MVTLPLRSSLQDDLKAAYDRLTSDFASIGRTADGHACFPDDDYLVQKLIRKAAARCGAGVSAAVKREKRSFLLGALLKARSQGVDVTPAVAKGAARRVLGRRLDERFVADLLATPGRTAANKSAVTADDLAPLEERLNQKLGPLLDRIEAAKARAHRQWFRSQGRIQVLADWRQQRRQMLLEEFQFEKVGGAAGENG